MMGVMADSVNQVMDITAEDVQPVPAFGTRITIEYLQGMVQQGKKFALLLNIDKILSADEVISLEAAVMDHEKTGIGDTALTQV
jgi:purine-binding chemotaxis protein CheW